MTTALTPTTPSAVGPAEIEDQFRTLMERSNQGDQHASRDLLALCNANPRLWRRAGDLQHQVDYHWLRTIVPGTTDKDQLDREMFQQGAEKRRRDLLRNGDSAIEVLLVDRIISAWYQLTYCELKYAHALRETGLTWEREQAEQKRVDRAQRQLLRATQALATIRRLVSPTQLNVGMNQINVTGAP